MSEPKKQQPGWAHLWAKMSTTTTEDLGSRCKMHSYSTRLFHGCVQAIPEVKKSHSLSKVGQNFGFPGSNCWKKKIHLKIWSSLDLGSCPILFKWSHEHCEKNPLSFHSINLGFANGIHASWMIIESSPVSKKILVLFKQYWCVWKWCIPPMK